MKPILLILGTHFSGSHLLARICDVLASDPSEQLAGSLIGIPIRLRGHRRVRRYNDNLMQRAGILWDNPGPPTRWWHHDRDARALGEGLCDLLVEEFRHVKLPIIHDPRLCLLLPIWQGTLTRLGWQPKYLLVARSPVEVAQYLFQRNAVPPARSYLLWARYNLEAERNTRECERFFITYESLLKERITGLRSAYGRLGLDWPVDDTSYRAAIDFAINAAGRGAKVCAPDASAAPPLPSTFLRFYASWAVGHSQRAGPGSKLREDADHLHKILGLAGGGTLRASHSATARSEVVPDRLVELEQNASQAEERKTQLLALERENRQLKKQLRAIYSSSSWRLLGPFRLTARATRAVFSNLRRKPPATRSCADKPESASTQPRMEKQSAVTAGRVMAFMPPIRLLEAPQCREPLRFEWKASPGVSVIIPAFNRWPYTYNCLACLRSLASSYDCEVIVVDDASTDETPQELPRQSNVRRLRYTDKRGFVSACNAGANIARGRYLIFLCNDTQVQDGWLDALIETLATNPDAGLVGSQLIYPDGRLQEAGGIVLRDASVWTRGRYADRFRPEFNYLRPVDYCSGASLCIPRHVFVKLGGFDEYYATAHYADTDLAFRVRTLGLRVYYQPASRVIRFESITCGDDPTKEHEIKGFRSINRLKFLNRWQVTLADHRHRGDNPELETERHVIRRILVCDRRIISPDRDSGSLRMDYMLGLLQDLGFKVTFAPLDLLIRQPYLQQLQFRGIECIYAPFVKSIEDHVRQHGATYDAIILSRADVAHTLLPAIRLHCPNAMIVFDTVDLHFLRQQREADIKKDQLLARAAHDRKLQELRLIHNTDVCLVVSSAEKAILARITPDACIQVVSNIHPVVWPIRQFEERRGILFIGNFKHPPNVDAVLFFARDVLPLVRRFMPDAEFIVVGDAPPAQIRALDDVTIRIAGHVYNLTPWLERCRLTVAPLRYGAGVKGKINSSFAHGVPVVGTSIALEGMFAVHGESAMIADAPQQMASAILQVHEDKDVWQRLSHGGIAITAKHFSTDAAREALGAALAFVEAQSARADCS